MTYSLCIVAGVGGNVITLFTMATADRKNKTVTNVFLISLTVIKTQLNVFTIIEVPGTPY